MKKLYKSTFFSGLLGLACLSMTSCGDAFDYPDWQIIDESQDESGSGDNGIDKGDVSDEILVGELKKGLELAIDFDTHKYQYSRTQNIDVFAGYTTVAKSKFDFGQPLYHTYDFPNGYYTGPIGESQKLYPQLYHAYFFGEKHGKPEWKALAEIIYAYNMHELVDFFGTIPYDDYRNLKETNPLTYVSCKDTYDKIFNDLDDAISILKKVQPSKDVLKLVEGEKRGFSNLDWRNWVRFANSIKFRMAMNMVRIEPARAQQIAEAAVNDEFGVIIEDFTLPTGNGQEFEHPLYGISNVWSDSRLGASLENIMKRLHNPLLEVWFEKNNADINSSVNGKKVLSAGKQCVGMRQGCSVDPSPSANGYGAYSKFQVKYMPRHYFKVVEILFLKAEGALRGWNMGGTAQDFYEAGIKKSFEENNVAGVEDYMNRKAADTKILYKDYYKSEFSELDATRGVQIGVKWDEKDDNEVKLEKIITQKYIANFPQSAEAWTTFRRTGYPRLFPVVAEVGGQERCWPDKSFDNETQLRRIPFDVVTANDQANLPGIEQALGGLNKGGTQLWWDTMDYAAQRDENNRIVPKNF